ncbi:MAG TPA: type I-E CRISPR-associated protein Cas5/CasD, partial [Acidobacteriota bacterium]|nr:type I-E CRISPR-associated protein Cas5/CasD [Acidobacteriota bacterium]
MTEANTLFLRLEGPLQAWGDTSKFVIRRTMDAPTKSGVLGLLCCAMGLSREKARERLPELNGLAMGVRVDRPGTRWWDYQTVGAGIGMTTAGGGLKTGAQGTLITRREYLADASFLAMLTPELIKAESLTGLLVTEDGEPVEDPDRLRELLALYTAAHAVYAEPVPLDTPAWAEPLARVLESDDLAALEPHPAL